MAEPDVSTDALFELLVDTSTEHKHVRDQITNHDFQQVLLKHLENDVFQDAWKNRLQAVLFQPYRWQPLGVKNRFFSAPQGRERKPRDGRETAGPESPFLPPTLTQKNPSIGENSGRTQPGGPRRKRRSVKNYGLPPPAASPTNPSGKQENHLP